MRIIINIILYTTHCPKCRVLQKKLEHKNINYQSVDNVDVMLKKGILSAPVLEVDGALMDFTIANQWINEY